MSKISTPSYSVSEDLFDKGIATFSGLILRAERIKPPIRWSGRWWIASSMMLSHSSSWMGLYEVVKIEDWHGDVFVYGNFDADWIKRREASGNFWHGVKVQIVGRSEEFVLGSRVRWTRPAPKPASGGSGVGS